MTWTTRPRFEVGALCAITAEDGSTVPLVHGVGLRAAAWNPQIDTPSAGRSSPAMRYSVARKDTARLPPPQTSLTNRGRLRLTTTEALLAQGISVDLGPAYFVLDDMGSRMHHAYFLAIRPSAPSDAVHSLMERT